MINIFLLKKIHEKLIPFYFTFIKLLSKNMSHKIMGLLIDSILGKYVDVSPSFHRFWASLNANDFRERTLSANTKQIQTNIIGLK